MRYLVIATDEPLAKMIWSSETDILAQCASEQESRTFRQRYIAEHPDDADRVVVVQVIEER